jgi:hypothetical protein
MVMVEVPFSRRRVWIMMELVGSIASLDRSTSWKKLPPRLQCRGKREVMKGSDISGLNFAMMVRKSPR